MQNEMDQEFDFPVNMPDTAAMLSFYHKYIGTFDENTPKTQFAWCVCMAVAANCEPSKIRQVASEIYDGLETQLSGKSKAEPVKK